MQNISKYLEQFLNKPIAILCMRYWYRGILSEVGEDYALLSQCRAVEQTGPASAATPEHEDPIPSDVAIKLMAVEIVCQPGWVSHELEIDKDGNKL